jgi:putative endonuclease
VPNLRRLGAEAEDAAAEFLLGLGYTIVTRRFKSRRGEIDIVAYDGATLVFIEVKSTQNPGVNPVEQVGNKKVASFSEAAAEYLRKAGIPDAVCRYDIVAVTPTGIVHHVAAFRADS